MWLQLTGIPLLVGVFGLLVIEGSAQAQDTARARSSESALRIYTDDDHVTVVSPSVAAQFTAGDALAIAVASTVDVVSGASVDVITQASPAAMSEVRVEGSAALVWSLSSTLRLRTRGIISHETDYDSFRPTLGGQVEVAERNATLDIAYTAAFDEITHAVDKDFGKSRRGHILASSYSQILDPRTYLDLFGELRRFKGYHASPYRQVPIGDSSTPAILLLDEETPALRKSVAARVQLRRAMGASANWFLHGSYRLYADDWQLSSHTLSAKILHALAGDRYLLGLQLRGYLQTPADFYQAYYELGSGNEMPRYRTRDRTLGGMRSLHASLTLDTALLSKNDSWRVRTMASATQFYFRNYPPQERRRAITLGISLLTPL